MIFVSIIIFISIILEGFITAYIQIDTSLLNNCFTIMALIIIFPYLYNHGNRYYIIAFIIGLLVDIIYTNTLFFNAFIYVFIAFIITKLNILMPSNLINNCFTGFIVIALYRIVTFLLLNIIGYLEFNITTLIDSITSSLVLNIVYIIVLYLLSNLVSSKLRINKID